MVLGVEGDSILRPPKGTRGLKLWDVRVHHTRELLEDAVRGRGLGATQDEGDRTRFLETPNPIIVSVVVVSP